jgi:hypothetical protein
MNSLYFNNFFKKVFKDSLNVNDNFNFWILNILGLVFVHQKVIIYVLFVIGFNINLNIMLNILL